MPDLPLIFLGERDKEGNRAMGRVEQSGAAPGESLQGLAGGGPSKVGLSGAMRARDVSRPDTGDEAAVDDSGERTSRRRGAAPDSSARRAKRASGPQDSGSSSPVAS
jgi:hypothetical protein